MGLGNSSAGPGENISHGSCIYKEYINQRTGFKQRTPALSTEQGTIVVLRRNWLCHPPSCTRGASAICLAHCNQHGTLQSAINMAQWHSALSQRDLHSVFQVRATLATTAGPISWKNYPGPISWHFRVRFPSGHLSFVSLSID